MIPPGWKIERKHDAEPFKIIEVTAPNGYTARICSLDRNPENVLYMLADALLNEVGYGVPRIPDEGWQKLAESLLALLEVDKRMEEIAKQYDPAEVPPAGVLHCTCGLDWKWGEHGWDKEPT